MNAERVIDDRTIGGLWVISRISRAATAYFFNTFTRTFLYRTNCFV